MRKIDLQAPNIKTWSRWLKDCAEETLKLQDAVDRGEAPSIKDSLYGRKSIKDGYFFSKQAPFYGKCAYCDAEIQGGYGDVDHFRPKGKVKDENDCTIHLKDPHGKTVLDNEGVPTDHPGYYWLAYTWHNLLPACKSCNSAPRGGPKGKVDRFPVFGRHAQTPAEVADEWPKLIYPASDNPEDHPEKHLTVDTETGLMQPLDGSERGLMCIQLLLLNRDELIDARREICQSIFASLKAIFDRQVSESVRRKELAKVDAYKSGRKPHTIAARVAIQEYKREQQSLLNSISL